MRNNKVYGASREDNCPFCGKRAVSKSEQGLSVCLDHKKKKLQNLKCICGDWLDLKIGKFGPYFNCFKCGNMNFSKAMEINRDLPKDIGYKKQVKSKRTYKIENETYKTEQETEKRRKPYKVEKTKKETIIRSDELDFYFG